MRENLERYIPVATKLAFEYPFYGSGADQQDVFQVAMITAWTTIRDEPMMDPRFVHRRMRLRVLDFVRERRNGQSKFERDIMSVLTEREGPDVTLETVLARDELARTVIAFKRLPKRQRAYLSGHMNGVPRGDIMPGRKPGTVNVMLMKARKRISAELAT